MKTSRRAFLGGGAALTLSIPWLDKLLGKPKPKPKPLTFDKKDWLPKCICACGNTMRGEEVCPTCGVTGHGRPMQDIRDAPVLLKGGEVTWNYDGTFNVSAGEALFEAAILCFPAYNSIRLLSETELVNISMSDSLGLVQDTYKQVTTGCGEIVYPMTNGPCTGCVPLYQVVFGRRPRNA